MFEDQIDQKVKQLLELKESFKKTSGQEWKPDLDLSKMSSVRLIVYFLLSFLPNLFILLLRLKKNYQICQ
jgi:hypothetical protein